MTGRGRRSAVFAGGLAAITVVSLAAIPAASAGSTKGFPGFPGYPYPGQTRLCGPTGDTVPPVATSLTLGTHAVDVTNGNAKVPVTVHATDSAASDASGVKTVYVTAFGKGYARAELHLTSGDATSGDWSGSLKIRSAYPTSTWTIESLSVADSDGNLQQYYGDRRGPESPYDIALQAGWDATFDVTNDNPTTPPPTTTHAGTLTDFSFTPGSVNTNEGTRHVTVHASFSAPYPSQVYASFLSEKRHRYFNVHAKLRPGEHGHWSGRVLIHQWTGRATASAQLSVRYADNLRPRYRNYNSQQLAAHHLPSLLKVVGAVDKTDPTLTGLTITPAAIDTTSAAQTAQITATATDADSGVKRVYVNIYHRGRSGMYLNARMKLDGDEWTGHVKFPQCVVPGTWHVGASVSDRARNYHRYRAKALDTAGFPSSVDVTSHPEDHELPYVANATASAIDHMITLDFTEGVKNVSTSTLTVYALAPKADRYKTATSVTAIACSDGFNVIDCSGADGLITSARLTVPDVTSGGKFQVWANQDEATSQLTDATGNPMFWGDAVARVTGS